MWLASYIWCCYLPIVFSVVSEITVQTSFGEMTGLVDDSIKFGSEYRSGLRFLGIPFAKPPTGIRRFAKPEPETSLNTTHNATYFRTFCPQSEIQSRAFVTSGMNEDCLYLNVFTPGKALSANNSYSVMIWIFGGGFQWGLADVYFADVLSSFNDVIVVTFNYRVNVLGFLDDSTGNFANNGLHDQKFAIDWVHHHIRSFGGDPTKVTLFGESAGGASVLYQALNPENEGKFQRIIAQSGSVLASWAYQSITRETFNTYAAKLNCSRASSSDILSCLRSKPVEDLVGMLDSATVFGPTVDGQFLETDPLSLFRNNTKETSESLRWFSDLDFLSGFNSKDGAGSMLSTWSTRLNESGITLDAGVPRNVFDTVYIPSVVNGVSNEGTAHAISTAMIHEYVDWNDPNNPVNLRNAMIDISTDSVFLLPAVTTAKAHVTNANTNKTYLYQFSHQSQYLSMAPDWLGGADHADEIVYVFGISLNGLVNAGVPPVLHSLVPTDEIGISRAMMAYWTNFAKTGSPNGMDVGTTAYPTWPPYDVEMESYIDLTVNLTASSIQRHPAASRVNFWTNVVPVLNSTQCESQTCETCETSSATTLSFQVLIYFLSMSFFYFKM